MIAGSSIETAHIDALVELVRDGHMTWSVAVMDFRSEFSCSLSYCMGIGLCARLQQLDPAWQKHLQAQKAPRVNMR